MFEDERIIEARYREEISQYTSVDTGIYVEGELIQFHETMLFNNKIGILLPVLFEDMTQENARKKYFSEQRPQIIKANRDESVNFSFSMVESKVGEDQLEAVIQDFHRVLKRLQPMSVCLETGFDQDIPVPCAWMEFISTAIDENLYNMLTVYSIGDRLLLAMFNCPFQNRMEWINCLHQIRRGIVIYNEEDKNATN